VGGCGLRQEVFHHPEFQFPSSDVKGNLSPVGMHPEMENFLHIQFNLPGFSTHDRYLPYIFSVPALHVLEEYVPAVRSPSMKDETAWSRAK
jgi:hypothetical protein